MCFTLAFGLYVNTLFNLIPLMPLDGYQAFADALRTPRLKEEAKSYLTKGLLLRDLRARRRPGPKQLGLLAFAVASMVCLYAMLVLAVQMWNSKLSALLVGYLGKPLTAVVVIAAIALLIFPVWYPLARRIAAFVRRRREAREPEPVPATG